MVAGSVLGLSWLGEAPAVQADSCAAGDYICQSLQQAKQQQNQNQAALDKLKATINDLATQVNLLATTLHSLEAQLNSKQNEIAATNGRIAEIQRQIRFTNADIDRRTADLNVRQERLNERVRTMDKQGHVRYLELVVTAANFNQLVDRVLSTQQVVVADRKLLDTLNSDKADVLALEKDEQAKQGQETELLSLQQTQRDELQATTDQQSQALAIQQALEAQYANQIAQATAQQAQVDQQVKDLQAAYDAEARGGGGGTGKFLWPQVSHYMSQGFGPSDLLLEPPYGNYAHFHTGIDIAGPYGTPIWASDTGVVNEYSTGYGYGNYIVIVHGNGWSTLYGHMSGFNVPDHTLVAKGQTIGFEGSTGWSTGPHLHFEIRFNNVPQDPCTYLGC
ncbi:MAG TPA: peptidoglycan DD-metalloendopeptidase family protein [Candidatus Dormibacteraeota bacterium]|nr:peptidoglycan DD-metalloendopeptidase family protein [Candidatus Dormibacteraeota bacterium]